MKISFIIPVYNAEPYISICIESILAQTYYDFEIVLVDDGSIDNSPFLCDEWSRKDARISVYHKTNGGAADARNFGMKKADGEYIVFIDGDDFWINKEDLSVLVNIANNDPDLDFIGFNCKYYYPHSDKYQEWVSYSNILLNSVDNNTAICELVKSGTFPMSPCLRLHKRSFLLENQLFFAKGQVAEDIPWFINLLEATTKCCFINRYVYAYRQNVMGSVTNTGGLRSFNDLFRIFETELKVIDNRSFSEEAKNALRSFLAYEYCILLTYPGIDKQTKKELHSYQDILKYDMNPKVKKASQWYKVFGIRVTTLILSAYQWLRRRHK